MKQTVKNLKQEREIFYNKISDLNLTPLWEVLSSLVPTSPKTPIQPAAWKYNSIRKYLLESGELISSKEAERRVLILENPGVRGKSRITQSLYAGLQLILPGEVAPSHRHSQTALRLVLDGEGAYTAVDGERTIMRYGDFIITPANTWHDHGNHGSQPVVWLDGLDIPLVQFLGAGFAEKGDEETQSTTRIEGDSIARYGNNMVPVDFEQVSWEPSKIFVYPYSKSRIALTTLSKTTSDPYFGYKLRFVNPATGGSPIPTIGVFIQLLPAGFKTKKYRSTDGCVFACLEGQGEVSIEDSAYSFEEHDIFVVPPWHTYSVNVEKETILFSYSDKPVQKILGLWREEKFP